MMYLYFRSQQIKAQQELELAQMQALTGIQTTGGGIGGFVSDIADIYTMGFWGQMFGGKDEKK